MAALAGPGGIPALDVDVRFSTDLVSRPKDCDLLSMRRSRMPSSTLLGLTVTTRTLLLLRVQTPYCSTVVTTVSSSMLYFYEPVLLQTSSVSAAEYRK